MGKTPLAKASQQIVVQLFAEVLFVAKHFFIEPI
jgi:hypothetical protein